jgi:hypothetical protein
MNLSKVYFTNLRTRPGKSLLDKLEILVDKAGIKDIDFAKKFVAIKIHFGEPGNLGYIRPNYAARIVKIIKKAGGLPFVTDANTLYSGQRSNAVDHLNAAMENGFNPMVLGCNAIIADGVKGTEYREVEINLKNCKKAMIGSAIADADIIISMNHFKGHELTGFGGALKNIGMGCASRGGKLDIHCTSKPKIDSEKCTGCNQCVRNCNHSAVQLNNSKKAEINYEICVGCAQCVAVCMFGAAIPVWDGSTEIANEKVAEYSYAVLKDKPNFHINFLMNISPDCDCWGNNDASVVADIGIAASVDPVALDRACADIVNKAPALKNSFIFDKEEEYIEGRDKFNHIHPVTNWDFCLGHAEKIGLGTRDYELMNLD